MATGSGETIEKAWEFERKEDEIVASAAQTLTEKIRELFRADGLIAKTVERLRMANERGPEDFSDNERDIRDLIFEAVRFGAQQNGYREAPKGRGNESAVIIGCTVAVISAFMLGAWQVSMRVTAVEVQVKNDSDRNREWQLSTDRRLDRLENRSP